ncbi:MAG TPA: redoxin domain-containing protein [Acetobacteraceae bacterium]
MNDLERAPAPPLTSRLRNGTRLPPFTLPSSRGHALGPGSYRQRKHLALVMLDPTTPAGRTYLTALAHLYPEFQEMDTEVLALLPVAAEALGAWVADLALPFLALADDGTTRARLLPAGAPTTAAGALVADRYGILAFQSLGTSLAAVDPPEEILAWVRAIGMQCSECADYPDS